MSFLDEVVVPGQPKASSTPQVPSSRSTQGGFLNSVVLPGSNYVAPVPVVQPPQRSMFQKLTSPITDLFSGAKEGYQSAASQTVPKSFDISNSFDNGWKNLSSTISDSQQKFSKAIDDFQFPKPETTTAQKVTDVGEAGLGLVNSAFSLITTPLAELSTIPVVGHVVDKVNEIFGAIGGGASKPVQGLVDDLPDNLISQQTKDTIKPLLGDIAALVAQIAAGKGGEKALPMIKEKTNQVMDHIKRDTESNIGTLSPEVKAPATPGGFLDSVQTSPETMQEHPIPGANFKQATKLTPEEAAPMADNAANQYWNTKIAGDIKKGDPIVIGADDFKDHFASDYNDNNHPIYSRAAYLTFERALKESPSDSVILTGGGPASGKTELIVKALKNDGYKGIIYDSNMASYDNVVKQIKQIRDAGKKVEINGVLPNLDKARTFSIKRENEIGRGISDTTFARGHAGFPDTLSRLLNEGIIKPEDVHLLDTRDTSSFQDAFKKVKSGSYVEDPLATLNKLGYNEGNIKQTYGKQNYDKTTGERTTELSVRGRSGEAPVQDRTNQTNANDGGNGSRVEQKPSRVGTSIETKAIEKGLTKGFGETAGYDPITIKDQAIRAGKVMKDMENATKMVKGEIPMEKGLRPEMLIKAMEDHAEATGNVQLLQDIANSPLVSETSVHAQAMRLLAERNPDSVVAKLREIKKAREDAAQKKGSVKKQTKETVSEIKNEIAKTTKRVSWEEFVKEVQCNY